MSFEKWNQYVHDTWEEFPLYKTKEEGKHYFVRIDPAELQRTIDALEEKLHIEFPQEMESFLSQAGAGYCWANRKQKVGIYNILSPEGMDSIYFPDEEEDWFATYRERAWDNLEGKLLAFCIMGEEDSLLYYDINDGGVYYLSRTRKIADSLSEFLTLLDEQVDYFVQ